MRIAAIVTFISILLPTIEALEGFKPARPPAAPLAVKSPYLSAWLNIGNYGGYLPGQWPSFWHGQTLGWAGLIRVDGKTYTWLGAPTDIPTAKQVSYEYTTTRSIYTIHVDDKIEVKATFLSPITPHDLKRQSVISSYLHVDVKSLDGKRHDVQIYTDISAEWVSGDRDNIARWEYGETSGVAYHKVYRQEQQLFSEVDDQTEYGEWYWATDDGHGLTHQSGADTVVRGRFVEKGTLDNSEDKNYRAIRDEWPVFGFASSLGRVGRKAVSRTWTITLAQDDAIQFNGANGITTVPSLWKSYFHDALDMVRFAQGDYREAESLSTKLDRRVESDSLRAAGNNYAIMTTLSLRQAFGAIQLVGTPDRMYAFLKEISSNGNVNTVDVIFPTSPAFLYTNPQLLKLVLEPLYEYQESGKYPNDFSIHDMGAHYPNATGHDDGNDQHMPLEESGNMLIMALAYYQKTKDLGYLKDHYKILKQWSQFLVEESLYPAEQQSTDDFAGTLENQTNLALKGMIGLEAMSKIAGLVGNSADEKKYHEIAVDYIDKWQDLGIAHNEDPPHTTLSYGKNETWGLLYNLYSDKLLGFDLVPKHIYEMQDSFYPTVKNKYGVPLDTRAQYTKGDWEAFTAAISSPETRDMFFDLLVTWLNETPTDKAVTDLYDTNTGDYPGIFFIARPVMGGMFALLALD